MVVKMQHNKKKKKLITKSEINKGSNGDKNKTDWKSRLTFSPIDFSKFLDIFIFLFFEFVVMN